MKNTDESEGLKDQSGNESLRGIETTRLSGLTESQWALVETSLDHIEGWGDDDNRLRFVYSDGRKSNWFSRLWDKITWEHVKPRDTPNAAVDTL